MDFMPRVTCEINTVYYLIVNSLYFRLERIQMKIVILITIIITIIMIVIIITIIIIITKWY